MANRDGLYLPKLTWDRVDWSRPDAELARLLGVSDQVLAGQRRRRRKGSSVLTHPVAKFREWVAANARSLDGRQQAAVLARFEAEAGVRVDRWAVRRVLRDAGLVPWGRKGTRKPSRLDGIDWRLRPSPTRRVPSGMNRGLSMPGALRRRRHPMN